MRKGIFCAFLFVAAVVVNAQNIQLHYDFGKHLYDADEHDRQDVTLTYELFKADKSGSWFYFIDADMDKGGVLGAYTELSREFNVGKKGFAAHLEFDGGLNRGGSFQSALLIGPAWNGHNADFSTTYSIQLMYKHFLGQHKEACSYPGDNYASVQLTGVWSTTFAKGKWTFAGFADLWLGKKASDGEYCPVFLAEPQLWYNISKNIAVGTEVELSSNFVYSNANGLNDKFYVNPTLAVKVGL